MSYLKFPSKAPYAWFVFGLVGTLLYWLRSMPGGFIFFGLGWVVSVISLIQIVINLINLIKSNPKFNFQKVLINFVLFIVLTIISSVLNSITVSTF